MTSNGTETTEIEDDVADDLLSPQDGDPTQHAEVSCAEPRCCYLPWLMYTDNAQLKPLTTTLPDSLRQNGPEESNSVIHAPESFHSWVCFVCCHPCCDSLTHACPQTSRDSTARQSQASEKSSPKGANADLTSASGNVCGVRISLRFVALAC